MILSSSILVNTCILGSSGNTSVVACDFVFYFHALVQILRNIN